jgi:hypothetical protein
MTRLSTIGALLLGTAALSVPTLAAASTIPNTTISWNTSNVVVGPSVSGEDGAASVVYQGTPGTSETNGQIYYEAPEANTPGLIAINDGYTSGQGSFDGCIRASAADVCATGFRTGNRFKMQLTDTGPVDLVFDVASVAPGESVYQVFGRAVNLTSQMLDSFVLEVGYGVGTDFVQSTLGDGLAFASGLTLGPNDQTAFTQYPFGLFGDAPTQNFDLDGFFDDARTGFALGVTEDVLSSTGFYGAYADLFGSWLSREMAPAGLLWDDDGDPDTDALVMAFLNDDGLWEMRRNIDANGDPVSILDAPITFATSDEVRAALGVPLEFEQNIEDLANLNLNYGILLSDTFAADSFTIRFSGVGIDVAPVPLPASGLLLLGGLLGLRGMRSRRKAVAA